MTDSLHQPVNVQFERAVLEFALWRAIPEPSRSPAPAWWWGTAFELRDVRQQMNDESCAILELPNRATYADGAEVFLNCLADQTTLPWPGDFPGHIAHSNSA